MLYMLTQVLLNRLQHVMADGCRSILVNVVSGVQHGSDLGPLFFLLYTSKHFPILVNKLIGYAEDSTLMAVVPNPSIQIQIHQIQAVAESRIRDLGKVSEWYDVWGLKLNASKIMIVSRSRTMHPRSPPHQLLAELK